MKKSTKQMLFDDAEIVVSKKKDKKQDDDEFKVNEEFARKFEHNKRRELMDKTKDKYGE